MKHSFTEFKRIYTEPMTQEELVANLESNSTLIKGTVRVNILEMYKDKDTYRALLGKKLTGSDDLKDISYKVVGALEGQQSFLIEVSGDASEIMKKSGFMTSEELKQIITAEVPFKDLKKNEGIVEFYGKNNVSFGISYEDNDEGNECYIYNLFMVDTGEYINIFEQASIEDPTPDYIINEMVKEFNRLCDKK